MSLKPFQAGLVCLGLVAIMSVVLRFTLLNGSIFDPEVARGVGPFALGDLIAVAAFIGGYAISWTNHRKKAHQSSLTD